MSLATVLPPCMPKPPPSLLMGVHTVKSFEPYREKTIGEQGPPPRAVCVEKPS